MRTPSQTFTSLRQLVDKDGNPHKATATKNIWVDYATREYGKIQHFAQPTSGNDATPYTTGQAYFKALKQALEEATEEILIAGWQINWDALLAPGVRLFDVLLTVAKKGTVQLYVMPWDDTAPVQTYDDQTRAALEMLNDFAPDKKKVAHVFPAGSLADESRSFFSHHQKQVVIDRKIAFVGGIDVAYGRFDDASYDLHANAQGREALNRYNGCIVQVGKIDKQAVVDSDRLTGMVDKAAWFDKSNKALTRDKILAGAWQTPYQDDSPGQEKTGGSNLKPVYVTIDAATQPRMPWQDVHCRIEGPAVSDLARNFIWRWNAQCRWPQLPPPKPASQYAKAGSCQIQVLRSAPKGLREAEYKKLSAAEKARINAPDRAQNDIAHAMQELILKADHFIYIENQFFVSDFGQPQGVGKDLSRAGQLADTVKWGMDQTTGAYLSTTRMAGDHTTDTQLPQNQICATLAQRIDKAIKDPFKHPIHVIITLPVHPEGPLNNGAIMTQIHWTMQSLVYGSKSLLNRIRRSLREQQLREEKDPHPERARDNDNHEYESIPVEACFKYVTLLNLRNWAKIGDRHVTEQVYVHSKLLIVDDRYAILGSANINDRSLLGSRDSELAVLVVDDKVERMDICGDGKMRPVRGFAHALRCEVWRKIFGLAGHVRPATELESAIAHPGSPASWQAIQRVAKENTKLYDDAFDFIPRNKDPNEKNTASIWPALTPENQTQEDVIMPFNPRFWTKPRQNAEHTGKLTQVKGFITALPIQWTEGENNNFGYHTALVVRNDLPAAQPPGEQRKAEAMARKSPDIENDQKEQAT